MSAARDEILARIRQALQKPDLYQPAEPDWQADLYVPAEAKDLAVQFADVFESRGGQLWFVEHPDAFFAKAQALATERGWQRLACYDDTLQQWLAAAGIAYDGTDARLAEAEVSFTFCEALVARTGSVLVSSMQTRRLTIYPPIHVVVGFVSQVVPDIGHGLAYLRQLYPQGLPSMLSLVTGPSRTADIEKTLVLGAHGPKELIVLLVDDTAEGAA